MNFIFAGFTQFFVGEKCLTSLWKKAQILRKIGFHSCKKNSLPQKNSNLKKNCLNFCKKKIAQIFVSRYDLLEFFYKTKLLWWSKFFHKILKFLWWKFALITKKNCSNFYKDDFLEKFGKFSHIFVKKIWNCNEIFFCI